MQKQSHVLYTALLLLTAATTPALALDGRCIRFCDSGSSSDNTPNWSPPAHRTRTGPTTPTISAAESEAIRVGLRGYRAWELGNDAKAARLYREAYDIYPNKSIRLGLCAIKNTMGLKRGDIHKDLSGALSHVEEASRLCPENADYQRIASKYRGWIKEDAQKQSSKQNIVSFLRGYKILLKNGPSPPPGHFRFADPKSTFFVTGSSKKKPEPTKAPTQAKQKGLHLMPVPPPLGIQTYFEKHDPLGANPSNPTRTADLILDALEHGDGSLDDSLLYLTRLVRTEGDFKHGIVALSYIQGLYSGGLEHKQGFKRSPEMRLRMIVRKMQNLYTWDMEIMEQMQDPPDRRWVEAKRELAKEALNYAQGDPEKAMAYVKKSRDLKASTYKGFAKISDGPKGYDEDHVGWAAYYYLLGLRAYPDLMKSMGK
jgi:hypothetical protein